MVHTQQTNGRVQPRRRTQTARRSHRAPHTHHRTTPKQKKLQKSAANNKSAHGTRRHRPDGRSARTYEQPQLITSHRRPAHRVKPITHRPAERIKASQQSPPVPRMGRSGKRARVARRRVSAYHHWPYQSPPPNQTKPNRDVHAPFDATEPHIHSHEPRPDRQHMCSFVRKRDQTPTAQRNRARTGGQRSAHTYRLLGFRVKKKQLTAYFPVFCGGLYVFARQISREPKKRSPTNEFRTFLLERDESGFLLVTDPPTVEKPSE
jgi:hypothetical protein